MHKVRIRTNSTKQLSWIFKIFVFWTSEIKINGFTAELLQNPKIEKFLKPEIYIREPADDFAHAKLVT